MKFFQTAKDGGKESHVTGLFFVEIKPLFSIVLLHFAEGTREAFHSHAFNAITWILKGEFQENLLDGRVKSFKPSLKPKVTPRTCFHKVFSVGDTWALSFRGPWVDTWREYLPAARRIVPGQRRGNHLQDHHQRLRVCRRLALRSRNEAPMIRNLRCETPGCGSELWRVKEDQRDGKQLKFLKCECCGATIGAFILFDPEKDTNVAFR